MIVVTLVACGAAPWATAGTWHVPADVPTIPAAMDSATAGDSIIVAPGTHYLEALYMTDGVILTSSGGPLVTSITPDPMTAPPTHGGLWCEGLEQYTEINGFHITGYIPGLIFDGSAAVWIARCRNVVVKNCVLGSSYWALHVGESITPQPGSGVYEVTVTNNTLYENTFSYAFQHDDTTPSGAITLVNYSNNIFWGHVVIGPTAGTVACNDFQYASETIGGGGNFSADPLFCTHLPGTQQWGLTSGSPCSAAQSGGCGLIGAIDVICGTVPIDRKTWGALKALFEKK